MGEFQARNIYTERSSFGKRGPKCQKALISAVFRPMIGIDNNRWLFYRFYKSEREGGAAFGQAYTRGGQQQAQPVRGVAGTGAGL